MSRDFAGLPEDSPPRPPLLSRLRALPLGSKIVAAGGFLLFFSLFLTWQNREVQYSTGTSTEMLDGWDVWGLLIGLAVFGLVVLVLLVNASDVDLSPDVRWDLVVFAVALAVFALALVKNLTDSDSTWASYVGLALAAVVLAGAYLHWTDERSRRSVRRRRRRGLRSAA
jgi:hypothetical protein